MSGAQTYQNDHANARTMSCTEFQEQLPELFEHGAEIGGHSHLRDCDQCAALVRDLEYIAQQAKLLLPIHDPSPEVWHGIQSQLANESGNPAHGAK